MIPSTKPLRRRLRLGLNEAQNGTFQPWAAAMRAMADKDVEMFLPAHGLPIAGKERIKGVLTDVAGLWGFWCRNRSANDEGMRLDDIVHEVKLIRLFKLHAAHL